LLLVVSLLLRSLFLFGLGEFTQTGKLLEDVIVVVLVDRADQLGSSVCIGIAGGSTDTPWPS
jgi:hypothetical protein